MTEIWSVVVSIREVDVIFDFEKSRSDRAQISSQCLTDLKFSYQSSSPA